MKTIRHSTRLRFGCMALMAALLWGCGMATDVAGGVGSGGSGIAEGAVTGFGSVVVDGVAYEDTDASVVRDNAQGMPELTQAKLGQRVRVLQKTAGVADQIVVLPQLRGASSSAADNEGWFQMLGQWVRLVSSNDTQNTATVLDGFAAASADALNNTGATVNAGDWLEVHGAWVFDSSKKASVLVASRIEKLSAAPDPVLLSGIVGARSGNVVTLDSASGARLTWNKLAASIAPQSLISAWIPWNEIQGTPLSATAQTPWAASRVVDASPPITGNAILNLGTQISAVDLSKGVVTVQGLPVKLPPDWKSSASTNIAVQMAIVRDGEGWRATEVKERQSDGDLGGTVSLKGVLLWPSMTPSVLKVRDVAVRVSNATLSSSCANLNPGDSVYVEISARRSAPGQLLQATQVRCSPQKPLNSVIEDSGRIKQITAQGNGRGVLVLTTEKGLTLSFQWTALTLLPKNFATTWIGQTVEVEYQVVNGENRLRRVKSD